MKQQECFQVTGSKSLIPHMLSRHLELNSNILQKFIARALISVAVIQPGTVSTGIQCAHTHPPYPPWIQPVEAPFMQHFTEIHRLLWECLVYTKQHSKEALEVKNSWAVLLTLKGLSAQRNAKRYQGQLQQQYFEQVCTPLQITNCII